MGRCCCQSPTYPLVGQPAPDSQSELGTASSGTTQPDMGQSKGPGRSWSMIGLGGRGAKVSLDPGRSKWVSLEGSDYVVAVPLADDEALCKA